MEAAGIEHTPKSTGKKGVRQKSGAKSGALPAKSDVPSNSPEALPDDIDLVLKAEGIEPEIIAEIRELLRQRRAESAQRGFQK